MNETQQPRPPISPESEQKIFHYFHLQVVSSLRHFPITYKVGEDGEEHEIKTDPVWVETINNELETLYNSFTEDDLAYIDWLRETIPNGFKPIVPYFGLDLAAPDTESETAFSIKDVQGNWRVATEDERAEHLRQLPDKEYIKAVTKKS